MLHLSWCNDPFARTWIDDTLTSHFIGGRDYLAACTLGLPPRGTARAVRAYLEAAASGRPDVAAASRAVEHARSAFARLVRSPVGDVAIALADLGDGLAHRRFPARRRRGARPRGRLLSLVAPSPTPGRGVRLRTAPLARPRRRGLAATPRSWRSRSCSRRRARWRTPPVSPPRRPERVPAPSATSLRPRVGFRSTRRCSTRRSATPTSGWSPRAEWGS